MLKHIYTHYEHRIDINDKTFEGETCLHLATKVGNTELIQCLVERGANLAATDDDGHTPLHDSLQQVFI